MLANTPEEVAARFDALHDAVSGVLQVSCGALTTGERLALLQRLEDEMRRLPVARHELVNEVRRQAKRLPNNPRGNRDWLKIL